MKRTVLIVIISGLTTIGCSKKEDSVVTPQSEPTMSDYLPLILGNAWTYATSTTDTLGRIDPNSLGTTVVSVFQTNTLIGGEPNAFILQTISSTGQKSNLAFCIKGKTMYHYLGDDAAIILPSIPIYWAPGAVSGMKVAVDQSQRSKVTDGSGATMAFSIKRSPKASIALAAMYGLDTLQVTGISIGSTTLALQKIGGTAKDTMTVLIEVGAGRTIGPAYSPWMPLWQVTKSTTEEIMYSWDTTYSFRTYTDSSICNDRLLYSITSRYLNDESVTLATDIPSVSGAAISCQKYEMNIRVNETVTINEKPFNSPRTIFDGLSTSSTATMWMAKGIGFVKGITSGTSLSPTVVLGGAQDSYGVLHGFYMSPRISYAVYESAVGAYLQYFTVDATILPAGKSTGNYLLKSKNF